jgi:hypothetical protein
LHVLTRGLSVGWNAGVWGVTIVLLMSGGHDTELNIVVYSVIILIAIRSHLIIEAASHLVGVPVAIFLSHGLTVYRFHDTRLNRVLPAVGASRIVSRWVTYPLSGTGKLRHKVSTQINLVHN